MTLEEAIKLLRSEYIKAEQQNWISNPLAYALYKVWKLADKRRRKNDRT